MDKMLQHVEFNKDESNCKKVYDAIFLKEDGQVIDHMSHADSDRLISKAVLLLESAYPDALCRIKDMATNAIINELKVRHYFE